MVVMLFLNVIQVNFLYQVVGISYQRSLFSSFVITYDSIVVSKCKGINLTIANGLNALAQG